MSTRIKAGKGTSGFPILTAANGDAMAEHRGSYGVEKVAVAWTITVPDGEAFTVTAKAIGGKRRANNITKALHRAFRDAFEKKAERPTVTAVVAILNTGKAPAGARSVAMQVAPDAAATLLAGTALGS